MRIVGAWAAALCLGLGTVCEAAGSGGRLEQHPWRKFGPGAWTRIEVRDARGPMLAITDTVTALDADGYTLVSHNEMAGLEPWTRERVFGWARFGYAHLTPGAERMPGELLTIMGTQVPAVCWELSATDAEGPYRVRTWTAQRFPIPLRIAWDSKSETLDLWLVGRNDVVAVGAEEFQCDRYEGRSFDERGRRIRTVQWRNDMVPGGIVRTRIEIEQDGAKWLHTSRVVDFGVGPGAEDG